MSYQSMGQNYGNAGQHMSPEYMGQPMSQEGTGETEQQTDVSITTLTRGQSLSPADEQLFERLVACIRAFNASLTALGDYSSVQDRSDRVHKILQLLDSARDPKMLGSSNVVASFGRVVKGMAGQVRNAAYDAAVSGASRMSAMTAPYASQMSAAAAPYTQRMSAMAAPLSRRMSGFFSRGGRRRRKGKRTRRYRK
jgi:hypothetical protein